MSYKWRPSKSQKQEFAQNMQNPDFAKAYYDRKEARKQKRKTTSSFDYESAGGSYVPTKAQHDFCIDNIHLFVEPKEQDAANMVMYGWSCNEKVHHDFIHIVNEKMRSINH